MATVKYSAFHHLAWTLASEDEAYRARERADNGYHAVVGGWSGLLRDMWVSLFSAAPELEPAVEPPERLNRMVMESVLATREWRDLRATTVGDEAITTMAALVLADKAEALLKVLSKGSPSPDAVRVTARAVLSSTLKELDTALAVLDAAGVSLDKGRPSDAAPRLKLARQLMGSSKLRRLAEMVGRFRLAATQAHRTSLHQGSVEVTDVELTGDLDRVLPQELIGLVDADYELLLLQRYAERSLAGYRLRSDEVLARGPIVVCLDVSGSMAGTRELWAKAVALALAGVCRDQKRTVIVVPFAYTPRDPIVFTAGRVTEQEFLKLAEVPCSGGTEFQAPLDAAAGLCCARSDIIIVTDGGASVSDRWLSEFRARKVRDGFRVWGVAIECGRVPVLSDICDQVVEVQVLSNDSEAVDMVFGSATRLVADRR